jgi:NTE family protein
MKKIGLALGAGGARGLAHIIILEAFEELGVKPHIISGTSIGAIIGAAYATGMTAGEIKNSIEELLFSRNIKLTEFYKKNDMIKLLNLMSVNISTSGIFTGEKFLDYYKGKIKTYQFSKLEIPIKIVATDYFTRKEVHFTSGNIVDAVRASYALPALFTPMQIDGKLFMDGGMVNPLPYDILQNDCDFVVGVDVSAKNGITLNTQPNAIDALFASFQIMQNSILQQKLKNNKPDILLSIEIPNIRMLEFNKVKLIWKKTEKYKKTLIKELSKIL